MIGQGIEGDQNTNTSTHTHTKTYIHKQTYINVCVLYSYKHNHILSIY